MRDLERRIERLEALRPRDFALILRDGSCFHHSEDTLGFFAEAMEDLLQPHGSSSIWSNSWARNTVFQNHLGTVTQHRLRTLLSSWAICRVTSNLL
jgi:hypothetical protein